MSPQLHYDMCEVLDELEPVTGRKDLSARHPALQPVLRESIVAEAEAVMRHLNDMKTGARSGISTALMRAVVEKLSVEDMVAIAAYLGARDP